MYRAETTYAIKLCVYVPARRQLLNSIMRYLNKYVYVQIKPRKALLVEGGTLEHALALFTHSSAICSHTELPYEPTSS